MKTKKVLKIVVIIITIMAINILIFINVSRAITGERYKLQAIGESVTLLKYKGEPITAFYVGYAGKLYNYPAYCLDKSKKFITNELSYTVTEKGEIDEIELWRYIVNGYPYKNLSELGCKERDEAYVATQQAIYCYIYGQKIEDYEPIGEAGERTIQAMKNIIKNAQSSEETPSSQAIKIEKKSEQFKEDNIDKNFVSKTYQVTSSLPMKNYKVKVETEEADKKINFKITDINNKIKTEFEGNENFKILIPIEENKEEINFKITIQATIEAKPIIYAIPDDELYQDFAIPGTITEKTVNETTDEPYTPEEEKEETSKNIEKKKLPVTGM